MLSCRSPQAASIFAHSLQAKVTSATAQGRVGQDLTNDLRKFMLA
jgi:protein-tyrosine-phosphatase